MQAQGMGQYMFACCTNSDRHRQSFIPSNGNQALEHYHYQTQLIKDRINDFSETLMETTQKTCFDWEQRQ